MLLICVQLCGGLGNQLFQYAAGMALAVRHNTDLILDLSILNAINDGVTKRNFELNNFKCSARVAAKAETRFSSYFRYARSLSRFFSPWNVFIEPDTESYNDNFDRLPNQTYLVGYWQSNSYFSKISDRLLQEFTPLNSLTEKNIAIMQQIRTSNSVSVHIRRGDYVSLQSATNHHGVLPLSYYESAISYVQKNINSANFFIFSDDIAWCKENLPIYDNKVVYVENIDPGNAWQDMILMSHCCHNIIANSSFSWWGVWLADQRSNNKADRIVIAPARWFLNVKYNLEHRLPSKWITL